MNFAAWLFLESVQKYIRSRKSVSPKNPANTFLVLYGIDREEKDMIFSIKDKLKAMGFNYFGATKTWSLFSNKLTPEIRGDLQALGVDMSGYDEPESSIEQPIQQSAKEPSKSDETLERMHSELEKTMVDDADTQKLIDDIEKMIERVANSTDEAAKQSFIRNFLEFSSRFYEYSLNNQMLIWIQSRGSARFVAGKRDWSGYGRKVTKEDEKILILAPKTYRKEVENPTTGEKEKKTFVGGFKTVEVYDVSATEPLPGQPRVFEPISRKDWSKDSNEDLEEIKHLVSALGAWVAEQGIVVNPEEMESEKGGYSAGGRIAINDTFKGINMFSTYVHEVAHELLHWKDGEGKKSSRQEKEIDAETTAYIVLGHFGLETKDTSNYLALWRATGKDIRARRANIQKAAQQIINGIKGKLQGDKAETKQESIETA